MGLQLRTNGIKEDISGLLGIQSNLVEIEKPLGFQFRVFLYINHIYHKELDYKSKIEASIADESFAAMFRDNWNLKELPIVHDFKYHEMQSKAQRRNMVNAMVSTSST